MRNCGSHCLHVFKKIEAETDAKNEELKSKQCIQSDRNKNSLKLYLG
jgi:hypothetical protein